MAIKKSSKQPAVVLILEAKAQQARVVFERLDIQYIERQDPIREGVIQFCFETPSDAVALQLVGQIPEETFGLRLVSHTSKTVRGNDT